jgi:xylan 1,4-beta-xylosidase
VACQDVSGSALPADFAWFEYREREYQRSPA